MAEVQAAPAIPFAVASQYSTRRSFDAPVTALAAGAPTQVTPIQVPAVGYLNGLLLEVTIDGTGGAAPAFTADAPFNVIESINFRNAAGTPLISPIRGFDLYLINKYGGQVNPGFGPYANPKFGPASAYSATAPDARFFLWLPLGLDAEDAYGAIPALASNANYQVEITLAAISTVLTGSPTSVNVTISATAHYFDVPAPTDAQGRAQATVPDGSAVSIWQKEAPSVNPGNGFVQTFNVGNAIRNHILTLRNSAGARIETNGWPALMELVIDNQPRFSLEINEWKFLMSRWYGLNGADESATGLDTGVFVLPYHALLGTAAGDPGNTRAQVLPTLSATLLQWRGQDWGSASSRLEILTQSVSTTDAAYLFGK